MKGEGQFLIFVLFIFAITFDVVLTASNEVDPRGDTIEPASEVSANITGMSLLFVVAPDRTDCQRIRSSFQILNIFANSVSVFSHIQIASVSSPSEECLCSLSKKGRGDDQPRVEEHSYRSLGSFLNYISRHEGDFDFIFLDSIKLVHIIDVINPNMRLSTILRIDRTSRRGEHEQDEVCWTNAQKMKVGDLAATAASLSAAESRNVTYPISHVGPQYYRAISDEDAANLKHFGAVIFTSESVRSLYAEWDYGNFETIREPVPMATWAFLSAFTPDSASGNNAESPSPLIRLTPERNELENVLPLENVFRPKLRYKIGNELRRVRSEIAEMGRSSLSLDESVKSVITIALSRSACATEVPIVPFFFQTVFNVSTISVDCEIGEISSKFHLSFVSNLKGSLFFFLLAS